MLLRNVCLSSGWNRIDNRWTRVGRFSSICEPFPSLGKRRSVGDLWCCGRGGVIRHDVLRGSLLWSRTRPRVLGGDRGLGRGIEFQRLLLEICRTRKSQRIITTTKSAEANLTSALHHLRHRHWRHTLPWPFSSPWLGSSDPVEPASCQLSPAPLTFCTFPTSIPCHPDW